MENTEDLKKQFDSPKAFIDQAIGYLTSPQVKYAQEEFQGIFQIVNFLKGLAVDENKKLVLPVETEDKDLRLSEMKKVHNYTSTVAGLLSSRCVQPYSEIVIAQAVFDFFESVRKQIQADIELIEPPKPPEQKTPYIVDVPPSVTE